jgi:hypothetical protein
MDFGLFAEYIGQSDRPAKAAVLGVKVYTWHEADSPTATVFVRYWTKADKP